MPRIFSSVLVHPAADAGAPARLGNWVVARLVISSGDANDRREGVVESKETR